MTRTVSLLPAATEIMAFLGATEHLVGVTHACDFPPLVASRARVTRSALGGARGAADVDAQMRAQARDGIPLFMLDERTIRALHPGLLLTQALCDVCAVNESDVRALASRIDPEPQVVTLGGTSIEGIFQEISAVAAALGIPDEGEELVAGLADRLKQVHRVLKDHRAPRPRVALIEWTEPVYAAGHWGPEQVHRAGGRDVVGVAGAHSVAHPLSVLSQADPEIVLVAPCGYSLAECRAEAVRLLAHPDWQWLAGRQVWALDANGLVSRPGPRVVEGIEAMARVFNPTLFSTIDPLHAVRVN